MNSIGEIPTDPIYHFVKRVDEIPTNSIILGKNGNFVWELQAWTMYENKILGNVASLSRRYKKAIVVNMCFINMEKRVISYYGLSHQYSPQLMLRDTNTALLIHSLTVYLSLFQKRDQLISHTNKRYH